MSGNGLYVREYNLVVSAKDAEGMLHLHWKVAIYPAANHKSCHADRYHQCFGFSSPLSGPISNVMKALTFVWRIDSLEV